MKLHQKVAACLLALSISFSGGYWLGYETPRSHIDPQDYVQTVFTPYEEGLSSYLGFLDKAKSTVHIAGYGFTEENIVDKLIDLKNSRKVTVRLLLDRRQSKGPYQKPAIERLKQAGIEVIIGTSERSGQIMHHKFTVVDGLYVQDGSWNYSKSADKQANLLNFINSQRRAKLFLSYWERMYSHMSQQAQD